jgi:hypothetical protein
MLVQRVCNAPAQARVRLWCLTSIARGPGESRVRAGRLKPGRLPLGGICPGLRWVSASQTCAAVELIDLLAQQ